MSKKRLIGRLNSVQIIPFFCYRLAVKDVFDKCNLQYKNIPFLTEQEQLQIFSGDFILTMTALSYSRLPDCSPDHPLVLQTVLSFSRPRCRSPDPPDLTLYRK
uniref:Uncharacterized protein n=1 Tax=Oryzias latipes TaxID=8090 RepID=A0A3P9H1L3_ORYLA